MIETWKAVPSYGGNMNDLISRKYLYDKIAELEADVRKTIVHQPKGSPEYRRCQSRLNELNEFKSEVRDAPVVEAKEVVHGDWIAQDEGQTRFMCSNCEKKNYGGHERFCPYCGCDMRISTE